MQSLTISGSGGWLKSGSRVVTELGAWTADALGGGRLRVAVKDHEPDPFWWEHHDPSKLRLDLAIGREGLQGTVEMVSPSPLTLILTIPEEA